MSTLTGYIGTYHSPYSLGIYCFKFNTVTGDLSIPTLFCKIPNAKFLSLNKFLLAAPITCENSAGICLLDVSKPEAPLFAKSFHETHAACFVAQHGTYIFTANYHEGTVLVYQYANNELHLERRIFIEAKAGAHQILFHNDTLFVPCLELDSVHLFDLQNFMSRGKIDFPRGSGPRHGVFDDSRNCFYVLGERSNTLYALDSTPPFIMRATLPLLPPYQATGAESAAIRLSNDKRFLYVSTRGTNLLSVITLEPNKMSLLQQLPCGGDHPRDILLTPDERFLLVVNRYSGNLCSFERDTASGKIGTLRCNTPIAEGVALILE